MAPPGLIITTNNSGCQELIQQGVIGVIVNVDKSRRHHQPSRIDGGLSAASRQPANGRNSPLANSYITTPRRIAGSIHNPSVANQDVEGLRAEYRRHSQQEKTLHPEIVRPYRASVAIPAFAPEPGLVYKRH